MESSVCAFAKLNPSTKSNVIVICFILCWISLLMTVSLFHQAIVYNGYNEEVQQR
ncbi:DUF1218 domain-containing protein [Pedobacter cryotolerans]|uniref:DUF1218 domain-containing protein n=1 Tax=Pedobacter cryotolerans TaxID=2571270 RepID=A0A4U1BVE0_9SPHI|nr:DUF1218 domain-containing protein [Pedobacter cryotolerans]